jgi:hypothetical protein
MAQLEQAWAPAASALLVARSAAAAARGGHRAVPAFLGHDTGTASGCGDGVPCCAAFWTNRSRGLGAGECECLVVARPATISRQSILEAVQRTVICGLAGER